MYLAERSQIARVEQHIAVRNRHCLRMRIADQYESDPVRTRDSWRISLIVVCVDSGTTRRAYRFCKRAHSPQGAKGYGRVNSGASPLEPGSTQLAVNYST